MDRLGLFGPFIIRFVETWEKKVLRSQDPVTRVNTGVTGLCNVSCTVTVWSWALGPYRPGPLLGGTGYRYTSPRIARCQIESEIWITDVRLRRPQKYGPIIESMRKVSTRSGHSHPSLVTCHFSSFVDSWVPPLRPVLKFIQKYYG